jgi:L-threonylcarbamoyladenylate synthase
MNIDTKILTADAAGINRAAAYLRAGRLVAFPTETVYGLAADARDGAAVAAIYEAKGRPSFNPLIVHVADAQRARRYAKWSDFAEILAAAFWPGPLTLVLPLLEGHGLSSLVSAGLPSIALRVPSHPAACALLTAFDGPIAAPSANLSGQISPTKAPHVIADLKGRIAGVVDDGPCAVGLESTIVGLTQDSPVLLRSGGLPIEAVERALGVPLGRPSDAQITAPGQLTSHYAPNAQVRLNATGAAEGEALLGFGPMACDVNLSATGDLTEAAARLFDCLHQLNAMARPIAVAPVPMRGLGVAINDRLKRAAAPRDV